MGGDFLANVPLPDAAGPSIAITCRSAIVTSAALITPCQTGRIMRRTLPATPLTEKRRKTCRNHRAVVNLHRRLRGQTQRQEGHGNPMVMACFNHAAARHSPASHAQPVRACLKMHAIGSQPVSHRRQPVGFSTCNSASPFIFVVPCAAAAIANIGYSSIMDGANLPAHQCRSAAHNAHANR